MKIEPLKMRVTPEQSAKVQEILMANKYEWPTNEPEYDNTPGRIRHKDKPYLRLVKSIYSEYQCIQYCDEEKYFNIDSEPELTYSEFIKLYDKWHDHKLKTLLAD